MPNVGLFTASEPVPPEMGISIRYTVEVGGLPVYTELYDVRKLASELEVDREGAIEAWTRRLEAPVLARHESEFSAQVTPTSTGERRSWRPPGRRGSSMS